MSVQELLSVSEVEDGALAFRLTKALVSNPNYSLKRFTFVCFVNHRLVDCPALRRALELLFAGASSNIRTHSISFLGV